MQKKLEIIINKELEMFKESNFKECKSTDIEYFTPLDYDRSLVYEKRTLLPYYSKVDKQVVFAEIKSKNVFYLLFPMERINEKFEQQSSFEWQDRYIFTFND